MLDLESDETLMLALGRGDGRAFDALFGRYRQPVWAFFRRRTGDPRHAEELAQETFVAVLQGAARWEARASFRSYLFGVAFNLLAAARRRGQSSTDPLEIDPAAPSIDLDQVIWVKQALASLEERDREILMLREYDCGR